MKQTPAPVISNSEVMPGTHLIWLESPQIAAIARPGQFVMVRGGEATLLRRPLSIHQADGGNIALLFNIIGKGTRWLSRLRTGDTLDIFGPLGNGFSIDRTVHNLLLVAGGIGIAPLGFLAREAARQERKVTLLLGAQTGSQLCPESLLPSGISLATATDDGTAGKKCRVTHLLADFIGQVDHVFSCGPLPMYRAMAQMPELKNKPVQISLEMRMGCGFGVCYGCTVKTKNGLKQVCKDGPVFELPDIINWEELII